MNEEKKERKLTGWGKIERFMLLGLTISLFVGSIYSLGLKAYDKAFICLIAGIGYSCIYIFDEEIFKE